MPFNSVGVKVGLKLTMTPGAGNPKTESAWTLGKGPKVVKKKQKMTVKFNIFLNMFDHFRNYPQEALPL